MLAVHADWSVDPCKRWMTLARRRGAGWSLEMAAAGPPQSLLARLLTEAAGAPLALGVDCPLGLPRAFAQLHLGDLSGFPAFLASLGTRPGFLEVAATLEEAGPGRPFYPRRGARGMTRLAHARALGLPDGAALSRACDRATADRPAGAPLFWTLGANQSGRAGIAFWRDVLLPAAAGPGPPPLLWPFQGRLLRLLRPGRVAVAETYPAEALRQLGLRPLGSKRRQADRAGLVGGLQAAMASLGAVPGPGLAGWMAQGFGADPAGEDRFDCLLGALGVLLVLQGRRPDDAPPDPWIRRWEGWVLGQEA